MNYDKLSKKLKKELSKSNDPINKLFSDNATPEILKKSQEEDKEYRAFITERIKNLPQNSKLKKHLAKLAFKKKTNTPLSHVDKLMEEAIKKRSFPGADDFSYLVDRKPPTEDEKRKALDEFIKKAQFEVVGTSRDLINRCHFVSLSSTNDHDKLLDRAEHAAWEIFSIPITWDQQGGLWCFYIRDLVRYIGEHKHMDRIPFPGKNYIRKVMPHVSDYVPDDLPPAYIPHIHRWNESCQQLNHQLKSNQLSLEEINSIKELGPYLNITTILNQTHQQNDRHHIYKLLDTTSTGSQSSSWTSPKASQVLVWINNMFDWIIQHRWVIVIIRTLFCGINLYYFLGQVTRGVTDHRIWRIILEVAFGQLWFSLYDALFQLGVKDEKQVSVMFTEVANTQYSIGFNFGRIGLWLMRFLAPVYSVFRVFMKHAEFELVPMSWIGGITQYWAGAQNNSKARRDATMTLVMKIGDGIGFIIKSVAEGLIKGGAICYDMGTNSYEYYLRFLNLICQIMHKLYIFLRRATIQWFGKIGNKLNNDLKEEANLRYDEYKGVGMNAWNEMSNLKENGVAMSNMGGVAAVAGVTGVAAPIIGLGLAGANAALNVYKSKNEMENAQDARMNAKVIEYASSTYDAWKETNEMPEMNSHDFCDWAYGVLQKLGAMVGTIGLMADTAADVWFLQEFWDNQKEVMEFVAARHIFPNHTSKNQRLNSWMNSGRTCVGLYNIRFDKGISDVELQDIHNPHERNRITELYKGLQNRIEYEIKQPNAAFSDAIQKAFQATLGTSNSRGENNMMRDFRLLSKYDAGRQILLLAHLSNIKVMDNNNIDLIHKFLPREMSLFLRPFGFISLGSTMLYNLLEVGDGNYLVDVLDIYKEKYPTINPNMNNLLAEFEDAQQIYVQRILKDTITPTLNMHNHANYAIAEGLKMGVGAFAGSCSIITSWIGGLLSGITTTAQ